MAGLLSSSPANKAEASIVEGRLGLLLLPSWVVIGILLVVPVLIMFVYSFDARFSGRRDLDFYP